jgi:hypothetical protein
MVVWLDAKQTQHAGMAFDVNSSLISIEVTDGTAEALPSAARRIRRQVRSHDSVLLLETACVLLLPATPFSGAQAVARRISPLLSGFLCELHVYHGATALLVLQRLRSTGARPIASADGDEELSPASLAAEQACQTEFEPIRVTPLPYLAFLTDYPSPRLLRLFPYELACLHQCVPVGSERKMLTLATCRWLDREVIAQLRTATRREIFQVRCEASIIDEVLRYWQRVRDLAGQEQAELPADKLCSRSR